jgi:hypothetical protein
MQMMEEYIELPFPAGGRDVFGALATQYLRQEGKMVGKKGGWDARMHSTGILKAGGSGDSQPTVVTVLEDVAELPARQTVN